MFPHRRPLTPPCRQGAAIVSSHFFCPSAHEWRSAFLAAKKRYQRKAKTICPMCEGKGRILSESARTLARRGGNASYLKSLEPGQMSISERGKLGGQPKALTIAEIRRRNGR